MDKYEHGGDIYSRSVKWDFSANINPLGMSESVTEAVHMAVERCSAYPDPLCRELCGKIAELEKVPADNIICGNGASDLIYRAVFAARPKRALIAAPTFSEYERALEAAGCEIKFFYLSEENEFNLTEDFIPMIDGVDMVFLCNPNNPTGKLISPALLSDITRKCNECGTRLILDHSFIDFSENAANYPSAELSEKGAVIIKAFTKMYSFPGLRLGYMICSDEAFRKKVSLSGQSWSVSIPAQAAGIAALEEEDFIERSVIYISREKRYIYEYMGKFPVLKIFPSEANFLLIKSEKPIEDILLKHEIAVRSCRNFRGLGENFYRMAVKSHADNVKLIFILRKELSDGSEAYDPGYHVERWEKLFLRGTLQNLL
ncbi:MAG: aminotransferase class I/II-fold pyridoxal phosphate-dependent enzyme [Oscillospiraceae bacterium]|nr:aminotransferase class I/II-fold pyridoxal phosphate-dependent enzyme [Oscillospiraceae bacterium]